MAFFDCTWASRKKIGSSGYWIFHWPWAFPNAAFKFKVGLFDFTWASGKKLGVQSIEFFIGAGPSQKQRLSLRLAFLTLLGFPKKIGSSEYWIFHWPWAFPNAAFKFKVGLFDFTWASRKKMGVQSIEFFIGPGPSQMQLLSLRLAFLTLLGPPEKNWEFRVLNFSLALGLPKRSV